MRKQHLLSLFILCAFLIFLPQSFYAASYGSALNAYERGDYNSAVQQFTELAFKNDGYAQYMLGEIFSSGEGYSRDYSRAYAWLHLAEQNHVDAASRLKQAIGTKMSRNQLRQAQRFANEWLSQINSSTQKSEFIDKSIIRQVQQVLAGNGYYNGRIDGLMGQKTRTAIRRYQYAAGLPQDGRITTDLLASMQITEGMSEGPPLLDSNTDSVELARLKQNIRHLARRAREQGAAEPWLIKQLEKLAGEEVQLWPHLVLDDDFTDTSYQGGSDWRVMSGNFQLDRGKGLVITPDGNWGAPNFSPDDLTSRLLDILLDQARSRRSERRVAKMEIHTDYENSFALQAATGSLEETKVLIFSCSYDSAETSGYRLILQPGDQQQGIQAKLFRVEENNATEIKTFTQIVRVNEASAHTVEWTRSNNGEMTVTVDGQSMLNVALSDDLQPFAKLSITHLGQRLELQGIKLFDSSSDYSEI